MTTLILDMDSTLIYSGTGHTTADPSIRYEMRPHLREFLEGVNRLFDSVIIWSAGTEHYVTTIIDDVYKRLDIPRPKAVFTRRYCRYVSGDVVKPLIDLQQFYNFDMAKTLIVDDTPSTFVLNITNGVLISEYRGGAYDAGALLGLLSWFEQLIRADVSDFRMILKPEY